ncbi:MAG: tyrosine-type recombinase/integrase [Planctomycetota bacterium]
MRDVTIYRRGRTYYLYYREDGRSIRRRVDGNIAVARATASKVAAALDSGQQSPLGFHRTAPAVVVEKFLEYTEHVQGLAIRTRERYRAALGHFVTFAGETGIGSVDRVSEATVEDFVKWLKGATRTRNGAAKGRKSKFHIGGIKFILSTCRTAYNWAAKHRFLPPYTDNPFSKFPIDKLRDRDQEDVYDNLFTPKQRDAFFAACDDWQRPVFMMLAAYGLRVGELAHLLVEDVDFKAGAIQIRSKPDLLWWVKTSRRRVLPIFPEVEPILKGVIGDRRAGFVFVNRAFAEGKKKTALAFGRPEHFRAHARKVVTDVRAADPDADEKRLRRATADFCRSMGQIPEKRIRQEFMKITKAIGRPELTRPHDLRHLFASRAQELGINPILVQEMLGHATLDMTRKYTHIGLDAKREALRQAAQGLIPATRSARE